jgi:hypothetical protein
LFVRDVAAEFGTSIEAVVDRCRAIGIDLVWSGAELSHEGVVHLRTSLKADPPPKVPIGQVPVSVIPGDAPRARNGR